MRLKYVQERASVINTASAKSGTPFIVSAANAALPKVETASFGCKSCGTEFASVKGSEPFCVNCGSENVHQSQATAQALPETDKSLCAIECKSCGTNNVLSDVTARLLDGVIHCVECGSQLSYDADDLNDPVTDADESDIENMLDTQEASRSAEDRGGMTDDAPITDATEESIEDALPTTEATAAAPENNEIPKAPATGTDSEVEPTAPVVDPIVERLDDDVLIEHANWERLPENEQDGCEYTEASLAAVVLATNPEAVLTLATSDDEIIAFADGLPVARLEKANAGEHQSVFHSQSFPKAITSLAKTKGVRAALASYNFTTIKVKFPTSAAVKAKVSEGLKAEAAVNKEQATNHREDLMQCVSLAATALTKNLFRTKANVLKRGFIDMLTTAGVKNPAVLVDRVFATHGDDYNKQVFSLAQELQSKPLDYRNTLAESMVDLNTMPLEMPNEDTEEVVVEHASGAALERQMEGAALRKVTHKVEASSKHNANSISSISASVGGLFLK